MRPIATDTHDFPIDFYSRESMKKREICLVWLEWPERCFRAEARELRLWYEKQYPFYRRMPVQKDILHALKSAEKHS